MTARGTGKKDLFLCAKKTGDFFGERAVSEDAHIRPATVRATTDCKLMYINRKDWQRYLVQAGDAMKDKVTRIMGERMPEVLKKDRKSGSAGMPRPISYAVFCLKKKKL
eukprot:TRINITY_DN2155_c0_g1_i14.p2 TRINITY_DN2155_c0_g1~~TRINITY_DN2155_c0_g1_i14.p2  ORF type:complete len:109 (+),score=26.34 TRINITY_DN2155_c0_g1_i14:119-445(+)